ncbi:MAG: hypothetical protein IKC54_05220 [Clostridia bacterium]|nr:hypothetical protein [Clostridia bacterium]
MFLHCCNRCHGNYNPRLTAYNGFYGYNQSNPTIYTNCCRRFDVTPFSNPRPIVIGIPGPVGPQGPRGLTGPVGPAGPIGPTGATGAAAGFGTPTATATTLAEGAVATATVTATGDDTAKVFSFDFGIPAGATGATGPQGEQGIQGETGAAAGFGTPIVTVTTLPAGSTPTVTVTATGPDTAKVFVFDFGIPTT